MRLSWPLAIVGVAVALVFAQSAIFPPLARIGLQLSFAYLLLVTGLCVPVAWKKFSARLPDYSYGIYIYAFPVQVSVIALNIGTTPLLNLAAAFVLTIPIAAASWHFVESPALKLKSRTKINR